MLSKLQRKWVPIFKNNFECLIITDICHPLDKGLGYPLIHKRENKKNNSNTKKINKLDEVQSITNIFNSNTYKNKV